MTTFATHIFVVSETIPETFAHYFELEETLQIHVLNEGLHLCRSHGT